MTQRLLQQFEGGFKVESLKRSYHHQVLKFSSSHQAIFSSRGRPQWPLDYNLQLLQDFMMMLRCTNNTVHVQNEVRVSVLDKILICESAPYYTHDPETFKGKQTFFVSLSSSQVLKFKPFF